MEDPLRPSEAIKETGAAAQSDESSERVQRNGSFKASRQGQTSASQLLGSDVPQGSLLGPPRLL